MLMLRGSALVIFFMVCWQILVNIFHFEPYILPSPLNVFNAIQVNFTLLLDNLLPTLFETVSGLLLGILLGMLVAFAMMRFHIVRFWLLPLVIASQVIPVFAVAPILVLWLGYGLLSKVVTVVLMLFFPVASSLYDGLTHTSSEWLDMACVMNGKKSLILWRLRFPAALPNLVAGIRVATVLAPMGAIVSEWVGASKGLGFLMLNANARLETNLMFACLVAIILMSLLLYAITDKILKKIITW